jgi:hypothetical protein
MFHERCFNARLPNYRLMSLIIGYLLRHVLVTPSIKDGDVSYALRELRFEEIMMSYGIFLLHDLNLKKNQLPGLSSEDSKGLCEAYDTPFQLEKSTKKAPPPMQLTSRRATTDYPWGKMVTYSQLKEIIQTVPNQLLKTPDPFPPDSLKHPDSTLLFMSFTSQIWLLIAEGFTINSQTSFEDLEDAIGFWTLKSIREKCSDSIILHPTYDGLVVERKTKAKEIFGERKKFFFPLKDEMDSSPLQAFSKYDPYYLYAYHQILETQEDELIRKVDEDLDLIFSTLQCLPASVRERNKDVLWTTHEGKLEFVLNAAYYRIGGVFFEKESRVVRRAQLTNTAVDKKLYEGK